MPNRPAVPSLHLSSDDLRLLLVTLCAAAPNREIDELIERISNLYHRHTGRETSTLTAGKF